MSRRTQSLGVRDFLTFHAYESTQCILFYPWFETFNLDLCLARGALIIRSRAISDGTDHHNHGKFFDVHLFVNAVGHQKSSPLSSSHLNDRFYSNVPTIIKMGCYTYVINTDFPTGE